MAPDKKHSLFKFFKSLFFSGLTFLLSLAILSILLYLTLDLGSSPGGAFIFFGVAPAIAFLSALFSLSVFIVNVVGIKLNIFQYLLVFFVLFALSLISYDIYGFFKFGRQSEQIQPSIPTSIQIPSSIQKPKATINNNEVKSSPFSQGETITGWYVYNAGDRMGIAVYYPPGWTAKETEGSQVQIYSSDYQYKYNEDGVQVISGVILSIHATNGTNNYSTDSNLLEKSTKIKVGAEIGYENFTKSMGMSEDTSELSILFYHSDRKYNASCRFATSEQERGIEDCEKILYRLSFIQQSD